MAEEKKQIKIRAKDEQLKGAYSNLMQILHTKEEFILDFFLIYPPDGNLSSRVIISPGHMKRMVKALEENLEKYESKYGKVEEAEEPRSKIGFDT
jgi:hypothetical protein